MYVLAKYKNKWAVLDTFTNVYYFIGCGRAYCEKRLEELNRPSDNRPQKFDLFFE
jgi:hypothetical protein